MTEISVVVVEYLTEIVDANLNKFS